GRGGKPLRHRGPPARRSPAGLERRSRGTHRRGHAFLAVDRARGAPPARFGEPGAQGDLRGIGGLPVPLQSLPDSRARPTGRMIRRFERGKDMQLTGKTIALLIAPRGTEEPEFTQPKSALEGAGAKVVVLGLEA